MITPKYVSHFYHQMSATLLETPNMHDICLGGAKRTTKTLFGLQKSARSSGVINSNEQTRIFQFLVKMANYCPSDFARKPRILKELPH